MESMLHITTLHYLVLGAALFLLGVIGVLTRRNVVIVLMSIELILNAVNLNLVAFSRMWGGLHGQVFAKTGTLDEVNALSGYVTAKNGSTLVFSVLCNGHMPNAKGITKTIDGIVTAAAETTSVR